ncbi:Uncharacterised protein [Vibrio cholerae]|nr:Uncharacterised protein [Vibrio cholerae]
MLHFLSPHKNHFINNLFYCINSRSWCGVYLTCLCIRDLSPLK